MSIKPYFKPSCDSICVSTCLACVDTLQVFAIDATGQRLVERCLDVTGRWETLCDLATGSAQRLLEEVPTKEPVVLELRAYRRRDAWRPDAGVDGGSLCQVLPRSRAWSCDVHQSDLMLWGRARPTDLSADGGQSSILVEFECRAGCDCVDIAARKPSCPDDLPESACVPGDSCRLGCIDQTGCFEGALRCDVDAGHCDPESAVGSATLPFCASCQRASDCQDRLCIGRPGQDGGFCARSCPDLSCPRGAKCTAIGNDGGYSTLP
ncbi:MAG: hypothetical protein ABIJ09_15795 [Pseudomonadota bacterium]